MPLKDVAASKGIVYGGYPQMSATDFINNKQYHQLFAQEYGLLVGGAFGVSVSNTPWKYNFDGLDPYFKFAQDNKMQFRGHPIIWHEYNSNWIDTELAKSNDKEHLKRILVHGIQERVVRFQNKTHSWDVVNEQINIEDGRADGLRKTAWMQKLSFNYLKKSFQVARQCDRNTKLCYNDYGLELGDENSYWQPRRSSCIKLLTKLKNSGAPIDALGIQSHLDGENFKYFSPKVFAKFLKQVSDLGLEIFLSELDVNDKPFPANHKERDKIAAQMVKDYLSVALDNKAVTTVCSWGLMDGVSWANKNLSYMRADKDNRPLLFDRNYQPKPMYYAVENCLKNCPAR